MTDDARFVALLAADPGDPALRMVYADWLEQSGELARAQFLRMQLALASADPDAADLRDRGQALRVLGETLASEWVGKVSTPPLAGTVWRGRDSQDKALVLRLLPSGTMSYTQDGPQTYENGTWRQVGNVLVAETNQHYADYQGVVVGDQLRGGSRNVNGYSWTWSLERTADLEAVEPRGPVVRTVHGHQPRRARKRAATPAQPKPKSRANPAKRANPTVKSKLVAKSPAASPKAQKPVLRRAAKRTR
ncbi:MAG: TIGR02996 domain-containing protein [Kofleriaceae bacterium]